ncbi:hypothetical protein ACFL6Y_10335, partial [Elusimicrobiota bacterium]
MEFHEFFVIHFMLLRVQYILSVIARSEATRQSQAHDDFEIAAPFALTMGIMVKKCWYFADLFISSCHPELVSGSQWEYRF